MKIAAISDLHGFLPDLKHEVDVLCIAGDFLCMGEYNQQLSFYECEFVDWLSSLKAKKIVLVAGNHDHLFFDPRSNKPLEKLPDNTVYLQDKSINIDGVNFYGSPWTLKFYDWYFMANESHLKEAWHNIPANTNVLITHSPPKGIGDLTNTGEYVGSISLRKELFERISPKIHIFGHIHEGRSKQLIMGTTFINATFVDDQYQPVYNYTYIDL